MPLAKRSVKGSYPLPSWMNVFRDVSVVMPAYRTDPERLEAGVRSLLKTEAPWREIIVVVRSPDIFKLKHIEELSPKVTILSEDCTEAPVFANSGYASAQGRWILSLEPESSLDISSWEGLCRILQIEPEDDLISCSVLRCPRENLRQLNRASLVDAGNFKRFGFLLKRSSLERIGFFDEELAGYASELHWVARVIGKGGSVLHCPEACIVHDESGVPIREKDMAFERCCNHLLLILRYAPINRWRDLFRRRMRDVLVYSVLHRSGIYFAAIRKALKLWQMHPEKINRLSEKQFKRLSIDWMSPYGVLG